MIVIKTAKTAPLLPSSRKSQVQTHVASRVVFKFKLGTIIRAVKGTLRNFTVPREGPLLGPSPFLIEPISAFTIKNLLRL